MVRRRQLVLIIANPRWDQPGTAIDHLRYQGCSWKGRPRVLSLAELAKTRCTLSQAELLASAGKGLCFLLDRTEGKLPIPVPCAELCHFWRSPAAKEFAQDN